jgi:hypothetical protein
MAVRRDRVRAREASAGKTLLFDAMASGGYASSVTAHAGGRSAGGLDGVFIELDAGVK